jgi:hypothetical protein
MQAQGMDFEDVRKRVTRIERTAKNQQLKQNLQNSLINQARLREGDGAARELKSELNYRKKYY